MRLPISLAILLACPALLAQSVVVPAANATTAGISGLNTLVRNAANPRTYMLGINAAELAGVPVGDMIVGVSFRQYNGGATAWPPADVLWTDYEVSIGPCVPTAAFTTSFAANFLTPPVLARDGAMVIPANTYSAVGTVKPWGEFYFNLQTPVPYVGGDLGILFSHPGSTAATNCFLDNAASNAAAHGVAMTASLFQATTGGPATAAFCIARVHHGYGTGCPGTGGMAPVLVENANTAGGLGGTILLTTSNVQAGSAAVMVFGLGRAAAQLPNGCNLLTTPLATLFFLCDPNGNGVISINVPPALTATFNAQAVVLDAGALGGYTSSNAVEPSAL